MPRTRSGPPHLYYEVHGEGSPLLLVMGLGTDVFGWIPQLPVFAERHRTIAFDNRDVGRSDRVDGEYEVGDMATDALRLADELELDAFHLLGMSMGGMIAQEMALAAPGRVRTLSLAVSAGGHGRRGEESYRVRGQAALRMDPEERADNLLLLTLSEHFYENPEAVAYIRERMLEHPHPQEPEAFDRQARAAGSHEVRERLGELRMPVHVIAAEEDVLIPAWKSKELARLVPGAQLTVIERSGHAVNIERRDEFNAAVLDFIAAHEGDPDAQAARASASERTTAS